MTLAAVMTGSALFVLNGHTTGVLLPSIDRELGGHGRTDVDWVVSMFLVGVVLVLPAAGWLADRFGRRLTMIGGLFAFALGALGTALAPSMEVLLAARLLQGLGGGLLMPVAMLAIYEAFPVTTRGRALGVWGFTLAAGPVVAPGIAGWVATRWSWRWVFGGYVAAALVAAAMTASVLSAQRPPHRRGLDPVGWLLAGVGVVAALIGARQSTTWGVLSMRTAGVLLIALAALVAFVLRSRRHTSPVIDVRIFTVPGFVVAMAVSFAASFSQFSRVNITALELQIVRGLDAQAVGVLMAAGAAGVALMSPVGGWLVDRFGSRVSVFAGAFLMAVGTWLLSRLGVASGRAEVVLALVVHGMGTGLLVLPVATAAMAALPSSLAPQASGVSELNRQLSGAIGLALLTAVIVADLGTLTPTGLPAVEIQAAYNKAFVVAFWFAVGAAVMALLLPGRSGSRRRSRVAGGVE